jgi:hypothetical protein
MISMIRVGKRGGIANMMHHYAVVNNEFMLNYAPKYRIGMHQVL